MTTTINISLPKNLYNDAKKIVSQKGYTSISELIRDALRSLVYPSLTQNGFTPKFEEEILRRAKKPLDNDVAWDGKTPFVEFVSSNPPKKRK